MEIKENVFILGCVVVLVGVVILFFALFGCIAYGIDVETHVITDIDINSEFTLNFNKDYIITIDGGEIVYSDKCDYVIGNKYRLELINALFYNDRVIDKSISLSN